MITKQLFFLLILFSCVLFFSCKTQPKKTEVTTSNNTVIDSSQQGWLLPFTKLDSVNPVLTPGNLEFVCPVQHKTVKWEARNVFNPAVAIRNDTMFLLYRAQDSAGCSRIGIATSVDGIHFTRNPTPVLYPDNDAYKKYEWPGGCEDPRLVQDSAGTYYITYTAYDGKVARLLIATSTDLYHWKKYGPVFNDNQYKTIWSKSGSIVSTYSNDKIIAKKVNGNYEMFWGDKYIWHAVSKDLLHWTPELTEFIDENSIYDSTYAGNNIQHYVASVLTRKKMFDADLVESGPPAMFTNKGILLIYNSRNIPAIGDSSLPFGTYTVSQVLLDTNDVTKTKNRMNTYFLKPEKPYELNGEVNNVCFAEALASYKNKWWLYYGTADSKIAVAVKKK